MLDSSGGARAVCAAFLFPHERRPLLMGSLRAQTFSRVGVSLPGRLNAMAKGASSINELMVRLLKFMAIGAERISDISSARRNPRSCPQPVDVARDARQRVSSKNGIGDFPVAPVLKFCRVVP
ncbi:hypothetical protein [Paraburkholderia caballeronis]|uniref:hypothetical protein n=1 Tax=Paraburkholderia caballeronis TaxID=416943 RepID=UPI0010670B36|nr:hypothetical protein [Paraburkholderia caballeronis]